MRKFIMFFLVIVGLQAAAQTNPITSITISLPSNPDANTANWGSGTALLNISANTKAVNGRVEGFVQESKILVIIKKGGAKICGSYTSSSAPASNFNTIVKVWSGTNAVALLGQGCILPPGDYELSVQFFGYSNGKTIAFSEEKVRAFTIRGNEQQTYQSPQLILPLASHVFGETDVVKPITFRWTPLIPRPQEPVTYRLRVWQLMQGQNGTQARSVNQPIITKDVDNLSQAMVTGILTGPCKPPYLCDFVWNVQALNREGKPIGENNGTSETFGFRYQGATTVNNGTLKLLSPSNGNTITGTQTQRFSWTTGNPQGDVPVGYRLKIVEIIGDQSPEQAFRGNKPIFEKDSCCLLRTNKPIFEKDSGNWIIATKPFVTGKKYAWNVQMINREGKPIGGNNGTSDTFSFNFKTAKNEVPKLSAVSPTYGGTFGDGESPKFKWTTSGTSSPESVVYKLTIVELKGNESPENAFRTNKPIFERDTPYIRTNKPIFERDSTLEFNYPPSAPAFKNGQKYAWVVSIFDKWGNTVSSKVSTFVGTSNRCSCGTWKPLVISRTAYECGSRINWNCHKPFQFTGNFQCVGSNENCRAKTSWEISKNGKIIKRGSGGSTITDTFTPLENGQYTVTLNATCGDQKCSPCIYTIDISDCRK